MIRDRWRHIADLFESAQQKAPEEREAFLRARAAGDSNLRREVESLLAADAQPLFVDDPLPSTLDGLFPDNAPVQLGDRIGPFRIGELLGAGGMGEVYRARDTTLNRDVALKILPPLFATDPERLARFKREAQVLAAVNDPHIAAIYGLEEADGIRALVMELVDGPTLADRIARGALPLDEALAIARQIADALETAHAQGIVHRDLKPANIKVRDDGTVKVLDFGLAKIAEPAAAGAPAGGPAVLATQSPTITTPAMTAAGVILGTAAYMAPEQAKGKPADPRSDIWAFGCVLYEMLTGRRAFDGEDVSDTLAAILRAEPDWTALPRETPDAVRDLIQRCVLKDRRQRVSDIAVVRYVLTTSEAATASGSAGGRTPRSRALIAAFAVGGVAASVALVAAGAWIARRGSRTDGTSPVMRFALTSPPVAISGVYRDLDISPDGTQIVYRAIDGNQSLLMIRSLNGLDARPLAGTNDGRGPFFSPDGRWVGFFTRDELMKVPVGGGDPTAICHLFGTPRGGTWGPNDTIVFAVGTVGLLKVSAAGGEPQVIAKPDQTHGGLVWFPSFLPGGAAILFNVTNPGQLDRSDIFAMDLASGRRRFVARGGTQPEFIGRASTSDGYVLYAAARSIRAVRFDPQRLQPSGDPFEAFDQSTTLAFGAAEFATSRSGSLIFVANPDPRVALSPRSLVWVTRDGAEQPVAVPIHNYQSARLSPDGLRAAVTIADEAIDIWTIDLRRSTPTVQRLTNDPAPDNAPIWSPDGRTIVWSRVGTTDVPNLYRQSADGTGAPERLTSDPRAQFPTAITADGRRLVLWELRLSAATPAARTFGISTVSLDGPPRADRPIEPLFEGDGVANGELSPDGRWLAYQSNESGRSEIYVRSFPNVQAHRMMVSTAGGSRPAWARNGRELFYIDGSGLLTAMPVEGTADSFNVGAPATLSKTRYFAGATSRAFDVRGYDVSPDGRRFLMIKNETPRPSSTPTVVVLVLNWIQELEQRAAR